jgi:prepilin-type N-terminal cleavage/methylation domain-containing protein
MRRWRDQGGFTLIELLVSMAMSLIIMGSVVSILTVFLNDTRYDGLRDQAQDDSRSMVDQLSRDLRSAASPKPDNTGLLQTATPTNIAFQSVIPGGSSSGTNTYDQQWVRYCLDSNETVWRQTAAIGSYSTSPAEPDVSACPSTSNSWAQVSGSACCKVASDVTNDIGGDSRDLFDYLTATGALTTVASAAHEVEVNVYTDLNPDHLPGPSPQLQTGIYLRNDVSPPSAGVSVTQTPNSGNTQADILLNGSSSSDPQGQTLTFQWYANSGTTGCVSGAAPSTGKLTNGTTEVYDAGAYPTGSEETFSLVVTNTGGLTNCNSYTVTSVQ